VDSSISLVQEKKADMTGVVSSILAAKEGDVT
jgi:hypothetical protein